MLTLLVIVLILSTACVIFQDKVADFLLKYIFTGKRLKRIDGFLSGKELRKEAQEIDFVLNASASELKGRFQNICKKYGKRYQKKIQRPPYMQLLPIAVQDFFEKYDYLVIDRHKILDIKKMQVENYSGQEYILVGRDREDDADYLVIPQQNENRVFINYLPGSEMSLEEAESITDQPFISKDYFASFENFLCYMDLYLSK